MYLKEIIRTLLFLVKQGLVFRDHREDDESENKGTFLELLELRSIENEIIRKIKNAKFFSNMMDETADISRHEQVSLVMQYTDDQFHVYERFIGFERAFSTIGNG
ncbi:unnamed protein product [Rotaria sp. Silwood1]|nr:unnamed protein product [Rotaria sp. Silwood1]